ncbi:ankyrin repeat-containing domain protein [Lasiosphaeria hispida]|uniref:GPI inositol-deacylase n=1 Tax=Lasiosphaeria hispida TaxID=260671 RepID=A0AAJ0HFM5_9PEZI|nr:ankyrin repeat-containing domain protein [Lasiosphaeria hispida]
MATKQINEAVDIVIDPPDATVDIVAIPGLGANPAKSWMWDEKDEKSFNWLKDKDGLQKDFPKARILLYHYASAYRGAFKIKQYMTNIAKVMLDALYLRREKCPRRPIVLIGHSMGGLVAAKVLLVAEQRRDTYPDMYESIVGVLTFGTPFDGAPVADIASEWAKVNESRGTAIDSKLLDLLKPGNEGLRELKHEFARSVGKLGQKVEVHCFYEELQTHWEDVINKLTSTDFPVTSLSKLKLDEYRNFVSRESATITGAEETGLARTHRNLVRFESFKDAQYQLVRAPLKRIVHSAPLHAKARFNYTRQSSIDRSTLTAVINALDGADVQRKFRCLSQRHASDSWILNELEYKDWLENERDKDDYLWIHGPEGKGKTTAVTAVIKKIESNISKDELNHADRFPTLLAYFFCDQAPDYCTAEDVVKSLLRQLCQQQDVLATYAKQFISKPVADGSPVKSDNSNNSTVLGIENLWQSLRDMLTESSIGTVYFVICNLHELPEEEDSTKKLLSFLQTAIEESFATSSSESPQSMKRVRTKWLFATRDRLSIRQVLGSSPAVRGIDLNDEKYGDKVKLELQRHAWNMVDGLQKQKGYNKAIAYFAGSVIGNRAESTKWIDVAIVQLASLPAKANDIRVRKMLERVPQDFGTLLDHAWRGILQPTDDGMDTIKELLRALVLTYEDPTESELLVLAGLPSDDAESKEELRKMIVKCKPLLILHKSGDEAQISFVNADVKKHLHQNSNKLLDLPEDSLKLQHGILALRCFSYIMESLAKALQSSEVSPASGQLEQQQPAPPKSVVGTIAGDFNANGSDYESEEEDIEFHDDESGSGDDGGLGPASQESANQAPAPILPYATKYWLRHASEATLDIAERLSLEKAFWESGSKIRYMWLTEFQRLTSTFDGLNADESLKALHIAASLGFPHLVESLIKAGYDKEVNEYDSLVNTPLHLAAYLGKTEIIEQLLLIEGVKINDAGEEGTASTPLAMAASNGKTAAMAKLISHGADINAIATSIGPVVNGAISSGNYDAAKMLIQKGAKLNYPIAEDGNMPWLPPLAVAALFSDLTMFDTILEAGAEGLSSEEYEKGLIFASQSGRVEIVARLLQVPYSLSTISFQTGLEVALMEENWDVIRLLLRSSKGMDCKNTFIAAAAAVESLEDLLAAIWEHTEGTIDQETLDDCLYVATDNEKESTVKMLLKLGAGPDSGGEELEFGNALTAAANDGIVAIVQALLDAGATVTSPSGWALQAAAEQGHLPVVQQLLDHHADVNHFSSRHAAGTALQAACDYGHEEVVKLLLSAGADPNLGGGVNERPIIAATMQLEVLPHLLAAPGIELNVVGGPGRSSPLHYAAALLPVEAVATLVEAGADVNLVDLDGDTPLMAAAGAGDDKCVSLLLGRGADIMTVSPHYGTALEAAVTGGDSKSIQLLVNRSLVVLRDLKMCADRGDASALGIIARERQGRSQCMAAEAARMDEEDEETELEKGLGDLNLGGDSDDDGDDDGGDGSDGEGSAKGDTASETGFSAAE